jgi:hypothetical protein
VIYAGPGDSFTWEITGTPTDLVGDLEVAIRRAADGAIVTAFSDDDITEAREHLYIAERTAPDDAGIFLLDARYPDPDDPGGYVYASEPERLRVTTTGDPADPGGDSLASLSDFESRHGDVEPDDEELVTTLLDDASALIRAELSGSSAGWLAAADPEPAPREVVMTTVAVAYRAWSNPDALRSQELGASGRTYASSAPDAVYLTARELRLLKRAAGTARMNSMTMASPFSGDDIELEPELPL